MRKEDGIELGIGKGKKRMGLSLVLAMQLIGPVREEISCPKGVGARRLGKHPISSTEIQHYGQLSKLLSVDVP